jgi:sugar phosphate isomerase/epimerase
LRDQAWQEREAAKQPHLQAALLSIRALGEHAVGTGVRIGVECRDKYDEIPSLDEYVDVFEASAGLPVGYWHDAGHGAKLEYGGFVEHEEYLRRYGDRLVGMHVHDTRGARDHLAPGQGETDFAMLARYLAPAPATIRTLELSATVMASQISYALDMLEPLDAFGVREGILIEI